MLVHAYRSVHRGGPASSNDERILEVALAAPVVVRVQEVVAVGSTKTHAMEAPERAATSTPRERTRTSADTSHRHR